MNIGFQAKMFSKKLVVTLNMIDPFVQQQNHSFTYGTNFNLENYNTTQTRNYRLTIGYNFFRSQKKKAAANRQALQDVMQKTNQ